MIGDRIGDLVVGGDQLNVVKLLHPLDQAQHLTRNRRIGDLRHHVRTADQLCLFGRDPLLLKELDQSFEIFRIGPDLRHTILNRKVVGAGVEHEIHQFVLVGPVAGDDEVRLAPEHPRHRAGTGHVAVVAVEDHAHIADRTVLVVGQALDHDGDAARRIPLVDDLLEDRVAQFAHALLDGAFDVGVRHVDRLRRSQRGTEPRIRIRIGAAHLGGDHDLFGDTGEGLAFDLIGGLFLVLDICPFAVTGHTDTLQTV